MSDLRQIILDASVQLVAESGVRAVSFREVARIAKVSHQAPYHYFKNHLEIMREIAKEGFSKLTLVMSGAAAQHPQDPLQALTQAGIAYTRFSSENVGHFRVMFQNSLVDLHATDGPLAEGKATFDLLLSLARRAHAAGYGKGVSSDQLAILCWSVVHGISVLITEKMLLGHPEKMRFKEDQVAHQVVSSLSLLLAIKPRKKK